jgi:predicted RNase H-like nuclease
MACVKGCPGWVVGQFELSRPTTSSSVHGFVAFSAAMAGVVGVPSAALVRVPCAARRWGILHPYGAPEPRPILKARRVSPRRAFVFSTRL